MRERLSGPRQLALELAYANVVMALGGVGYAAAALHLAGRPITFVPVLLTGLIVFVVYTIDKVALLDPAADAVNDPDRTAFLVRWRPQLLAAAGLSMLIGSIVAAGSSITCLVLFVLPIPIGLAYAIKFLPEGWRYRRLKDVTGGKSGSVALTWGVMGGVMPLVYVGGVAPEPLLIAGTYVCLRMFVNTAFFDIADLPGDRAAGTVTIPVALGLHATRRLLHLVNVVSVVVLVVATAAGLVTSAGYVIAIVGGAWGWHYVRQARAEDSDLGFTCDVIADGDGFVLGVVAAILAVVV